MVKKIITFLLLYLLKFLQSFQNGSKTSNAATSSSNRRAISLPCGDEVTFSGKSIFFIETAKRGLNYREACSVESAAKSHPHRPIVVLFPEPPQLYLNTKPVTALSNYKNIKLYSLNVTKYSRDTPLEYILTKLNLQFKQNPRYRKWDILKYLTLYKFGGIYSDLGLIMVKNLDNLPNAENWAGMDSYQRISSHVMSIGRETAGGNLVINTCVNILQRKFNPFKKWTQSSNGILDEALSQICGRNKTMLNGMTAGFPWESGVYCKGFQIYGPETFFPIPHSASKQFFKKSKESLEINEDTYAYFTWSDLTRNLMIPKDSLYAQLARKFCPYVNRMSAIPPKVLKKKTNLKKPKPYYPQKFMEIAKSGQNRVLFSEYKNTTFNKNKQNINKRNGNKPDVKKQNVNRQKIYKQNVNKQYVNKQNVNKHNLNKQNVNKQNMNKINKTNANKRTTSNQNANKQNAINKQNINKQTNNTQNKSRKNDIVTNMTVSRIKVPTPKKNRTRNPNNFLNVRYRNRVLSSEQMLKKIIKTNRTMNNEERSKNGLVTLS